MMLLLGILFDFMGMTYYRTNKDISVGDTVVVTTPHGDFASRVVKVRTPSEEELKKPNFNELFPEIVRIATFNDISFIRESEKRANQISKSTQELSNQLKLGMKVLKSYLDIDEEKVLVTFTSDARVDFRELVRLLNGTYHMRIELRQIGPRDQAKLVGGIGSCGLPLCCTTFLNSFDGISIAMAKNQLLSINIPKLSGQCGKLMCCLKFEDEAYAQIRPNYPKIGEKFTYNNKNYEVTGLNLLTDTITTYNGDNYESFSKEEYERVKKGLTKNDGPTLAKTDVNANVDLSGYGVKDTLNRINQIEKNEKRHQDDIKSKVNNNGRNNPNNHNRNSNQNNPHNNNNKNQNHGNNPQQNRQNQNNQHNNQNHGNQNNSRSFNNKNNHSFNNNSHGYNNHNNHNANAPKKDSGFIPVSQISDKSVLDFKPIKDDDKK